MGSAFLSLVLSDLGANRELVGSSCSLSNFCRLLVAVHAAQHHYHKFRFRNNPHNISIGPNQQSISGSEGLELCVFVPQYLTPLRFHYHLVGCASRVDCGLELLQNRTTILLL